MKEIFISSGALIAALLALRFFFRNAISRRAQYALWGLVLVRLLVPVSLPAMPLSVLNAGAQTQAAVTRSFSRPVYLRPVSQTPAGEAPAENEPPSGAAVPGAQTSGYRVLSPDGKTVTNYAEKATVGELLSLAWMAGMAVTGLFFLVTNLHFWHKLHKIRTPYSVGGCSRPVYLCGGLPSPCLFGLFRPAIYLTAGAVASERSLRHVIAHEESHARHLDPLWSLLRCICLTVYWFHPLVWVAAAVSRADCELACDEGTLARLGGGERLAYGQTLLSLIPVGTTRGNPLLSATTMTAGKRRMKDRISRIAKQRKTVTFSVLAAGTLVLAVSACTFTGAKTGGATTLTGPELAYFNEQFFNSDGGEFNICNQFLSSVYEKPEEIDLHELFYCGIPRWEKTGGSNPGMSDAELQAAFGGTSFETAVYKLTAQEMDSVFSKYTGLTLADTGKAGLDRFTYLDPYDAYYFMHGDTNYRGIVNITAGEREGDLVRLYYKDDFYGDGWKCVTLREADGSYRFVSNLTSEKPTIPTVLPAGDPVLTIPLDRLEPHTPQEVATQRRTDDCAERLDGMLVGDTVIRIYRSTDGNRYAAVVNEEAVGSGGMSAWDADCFFTLPGEGDYTVSFFGDLFGRDGIIISYTGERSPHAYTTFNDLYYLTDSGAPVLLARAYGVMNIADINGDGRNELLSETQIFFQKDERLYEAYLPALLKDAWPEMESWDYADWDVGGRYLTACGFVGMPDWGARGAYFWRYLYFDGEKLLIYQKSEAATGHVLDAVTGPEDVLALARQAAQEAYEAAKSEDWGKSFDDWRVSCLGVVDIGPVRSRFANDVIEVYAFDYEFHTAAPAEIMLAGGVYLTEGSWFGGMYSEKSTCLVFHVRDGQRVLLDSSLPGYASTDSPAFREALTEALLQAGLVPVSEND